MSMSVRCAGCGLQYAGQRGLAGLAAGLPRGRGRYLRMLAEVPRFHRAARRLLDHGDHDGQVLADFLRTGGFSRYFTAHFALPLVAAVWSCPTGTALRYPARYLFAFLANHGMLSVSGSPPWRTVTGGSRRYVERAAKRLPDIRLSTPVRAVRRYPDRAEVRDAAGEAHRFDAVVIATHPDQALRLLDPPTDAERDVLGAFTYTQNPALLHTDATLLPRRPAVRASWNYELSGCEPDRAAPRISYDMNRLQNLAGGEDYIVTLGGAGPGRPGPGHRPDGVRASGLHAGLGRRAAPPARAEHGRHRVRRRLPRLGLPRGRLPVRRGGGPGPRRHLVTARCTRSRSATPVRPRCATCSATAATCGWSTSTTCPGSRWLARFRARDHLGDPRASIRANLDRFLAARGVDLGGGRVTMLAHARVLGYVFNPLTVYWCHRPDGTLACVVAEVHNTYRQRHAYLLPADDGAGPRCRSSSTSRRSTRSTAATG